jgi:protein-S-isoprenylcysteine O-methyltransferase Ste14
MKPMTSLIFALAFAALALLAILLALTVFSGVLAIWPTPYRGSWQSYVFWPLFRGGLGGTILLGVWQFAAAPSHGLEAAIGVPLALCALAVTVHGYFALGIENTYGASRGLVTTGLYRFSRNPQYVASIAGFLGLALAAATQEIAALSTLAVAVYVLLPFAEEPWLARTYGERYSAYARTTPRFLSLAKLLQKTAATQH